MERERRTVRPQLNFYNQLKKAVEEPKGKEETLGILRAFSRRVFEAISTNRAEQIDPVEDAASYLWRTLNAKKKDENANSSVAFTGGYITALCDVISAAQDAALSEETIDKASKNGSTLRVIEELVRREDAYDSLEGHLVTFGELSKKLCLEGDELAKVLGFTELYDLTRRSTLGKNRNKHWIGLGPQGRAYYNALVEVGAIKKPEKPE